MTTPMPNDNELRALVGPLQTDIDVMRDVYLTRSQREAFDRICALAAAPAGGEVDGWRPIDTAPKDISLALVAWMDGDWQYDFERREDGRWWQHEDNREHYVAVSHIAGVTVTGPPETAPYTHWRSIAPPALHTPTERT